MSVVGPSPQLSDSIPPHPLSPCPSSCCSFEDGLDQFGMPCVVHSHLNPVMLLSARGIGAHVCNLVPGKTDASELKEVRDVTLSEAGMWVRMLLIPPAYWLCAE